LRLISISAVHLKKQFVFVFIQASSANMLYVHRPLGRKIKTLNAKSRLVFCLTAFSRCRMRHRKHAHFSLYSKVV